MWFSLSAVEWGETLFFLSVYRAGPEDLSTAQRPTLLWSVTEMGGKVSHTHLSLSLSPDVEVMETLHRPFNVRERTLCVPHLGTPHTPTPHKLTHPTLSHVTLYTAQPAKSHPGHTGFLTFATLPPLTPSSPTQSPSSAPINPSETVQ